MTNDDREAIYDKSKAAGVLPDGAIAVGVAQHPDTGLFYACFSLYGRDLAVIGVSGDLAQARAWIEELGAIFAQTLTPETDVEGQIEGLMTRARELSGSDYPPLPQSIIDTMFAKIACTGRALRASTFKLAKTI